MHWGDHALKAIGLPIAIIVAGLIALGYASDFMVDWAWFSSVGYVGVFWTVLVSKAAVFVAVFAASTCFYG